MHTGTGKKAAWLDTRGKNAWKGPWIKRGHGYIGRLLL